MNIQLQQHNHHRRRHHRRPPARSSSSIYPLHPPDCQWLARVSDTELTTLDRILVAGSSLIIVGAVVWVPCVLVWAYRRWKERVVSPRRKAVYATLFLAALGVYLAGPHKRKSVGDWIQVRKWKLWQAWIRFLAVEIILDQPQNQNKKRQHDAAAAAAAPPLDWQKDAMLAFVPHGIFPFSLGVGAITDYAVQVFGVFRPIVASAVLRVPILGDLVAMLDGLDASRPQVNAALAQGHRVGVIPGGIQEMFTGYPRPGCHPDEEYAIVRKGFLRMALRHGRQPVVPIYCFGSTKLFRRWHIPWLETLSHVLRMSIILFYGVGGLPIPFRQRLTYVVGDPIMPPPAPASSATYDDSRDMDQAVDALHEQFCQELQRLFERHKEAYGWGHKTLKLLSK